MTTEMATNTDRTTAAVGASNSVSLYDRFAQLYDLTFKLNGYERTLVRYLREQNLPLPAAARVLDAGCGTGLLTLALMRALRRPARISAVDLSAPSLLKARQAVGSARPELPHKVSFTQGNVLSLPFADGAFSFVVTSGALEYVPLADGLAELARVTAPGGYFLHLPVHPAPASTFLEVLFRFKTHPPQQVDALTRRHFHILTQHRFPVSDVIGWTKTAILAQKL